jgi:serine protease AprX
LTHAHLRRLVLGLASLLLAGPALASDLAGPKLRRLLASTSSDGPFLVWVRLQETGARKSVPQPSLVSARSLERRAKVLPPSRIVDTADLPLDESAVAQVASHVDRVRHRSKWFNAVSALATREQIRALGDLKCVRSVELVARFRHNGSEQADLAGIVPPRPSATGSPRVPPGGKPNGGTPLDYGPSLPQAAMINVPALHELGLHGEGVLIGHFDNGYRLLQHEVFQQLHIVAGHDFVDHDNDPAPPVAAPQSYGAHGISTLSVLAGYAPGKLIGPAFGADLVLARTENDASETPLEEDNWVAAIEWADSLGVDVVSSSIGYLDYDPPNPSWTWEDMDGNTTLITRAADMAVARGIVVVSAAGNNGFDFAHNTLVAPADGDSVITVGGVFPDSVRYFSSSGGPTTDNPPRIKPDVMTMGGLDYIALATGTNQYTFSAGTSFACPLAAGVVALLLQARPSATPMQIREALRATASNAASPNNEYGWGIIDAVAALGHLTTSVQSASWTAVKGAYR